MYICYFDGSTKKEDIVVVSGILCSLNERYGSIENIIYCFKNNFNIPYGYSIYEELAAINAAYECRECLDKKFLNKEHLIFINDSKSLNEKINNPNANKNLIEILSEKILNHKNTDDCNKKVKMIKGISNHFKDVNNLYIDKNQFVYGKRSNTGIMIADKLNKEINQFVSESSQVFLEGALKKLLSRNYLYDERKKR